MMMLIKANKRQIELVKYLGISGDGFQALYYSNSKTFKDLKANFNRIKRTELHSQNKTKQNKKKQLQMFFWNSVTFLMIQQILVI